MGMRMDQYFGLNERAHKWLEENGVHLRVRITREVRDVTSSEFVTQATHEFDELQSEQYDVIPGAFDETAGNLLYYPLKNGGQAREYVQKEPWSSGPCYFIALKIEDEPLNETLWTNKEINSALGEETTFVDESDEELEIAN